MQRMDHQYIHLDNDKLENDYNNCIELRKHNYQRMDQHIVHLCKLNYEDIQSLSYIRVYNLVRDQDNLANMSRQPFHQPSDIGCLARKALVHNQQLV